MTSEMTTTPATTTRTTTPATATPTPTTTDEASARLLPRRRWGIRGRIVFGYLALLLAALVVSLFVTRAAMLSRVDRTIDEALFQEVEELRRLATIGIDPVTGEPFGADVTAILDTFLVRNIPSTNEAFYSLVDGQPYLASFGAPLEVLDEPGLVEQWAASSDRTVVEADTALGEIRYLAAPIVLDGERRGLFVVVHFTEADEDEVGAVFRLEALVGAVVFALAAVLAWNTVGRVVRPIGRLTAAARTITENDLSTRMPVDGDDELAELGRTFNAMLDRLDAGFTGQRQFLDDVAHELRTPITIVQGHLELLGDDPDDQAATLRLVQDELDRMHRYVDDLLLLAKAESTDFLRPQPVDVGELAATLLRKVEPLAERAWSVDAAPRPGALAVVADPDRISQAVLNLATNAVQNTHPGDTIAIGFEPIPDPAGATGVRIWVRDTGDGLDASLAERIFDRSSRGVASRVGRIDGLGIGLSIVATIVAAHGGTVRAANNRSGGACFTIELPGEPEPADRRDEDPAPGGSP